MAEPADCRREFFPNVLRHLVQLAGRRRVFRKKISLQPYGSERPGEGLPQLPVFRADHLRAAPADIDDQRPLARLRPGAFHAQVDETRFFTAGNDLGLGPAASEARARNSAWLRVSRIALVATARTPTTSSLR